MDAMKNPLEDFSFADPFSTWWPIIIAVLVGVVTTIRSYFGGPSCPSEATIINKVVVITGGSSGIGLQVVAELLKRGGRIIIGARDVESAQEEVRKIIKSKKISKDASFLIKKLDLSSLKSVREFVDNIDESKVDILINNGGIVFHPFQKTDEGFETHFVTNYLSHFLLTHLLLPKLKKSEEARIINVSAQAHYVADIYLDDLNIETQFNSNKAFGQSKLALVMMARHMAKILQGTNVKINAMHPGIVRGTKHMRHSPLSKSLVMKIAMGPWAWLLMKNPEQGAQTIIYMAVATELSKTSGKYFSNCSETEPSDKGKDEDVAEKLYQKSLELIELQT